MDLFNYLLMRLSIYLFFLSNYLFVHLRLHLSTRTFVNRDASIFTLQHFGTCLLAIQTSINCPRMILVLSVLRSSQNLMLNQFYT